MKRAISWGVSRAPVGLLVSKGMLLCGGTSTSLHHNGSLSSHRALTHAFRFYAPSDNAGQPAAGNDNANPAPQSSPNNNAAYAANTKRKLKGKKKRKVKGKVGLKKVKRQSAVSASESAIAPKGAVKKMAKVPLKPSKVVATPAIVPKKRQGRKKIRVCVLNSSYEGTGSVTASVDNYLCTPAHYVKKNKKNYSFDDVAVNKVDSFRTVRELVTSDKYDVFFNLCDGARDEKRAGVDVVNALEEFNAAFTGTDSRSFEPSKIDMKLLVGSSGVKVPNFVLLSSAEGLAKKCRHLHFPVIVKHLSGYASVGIHKDNRCDNFDQLKHKVVAFLKEFNHAMVEEFVRGREGTVLACADNHSPHGVKVFQPLMFSFLENGDDFAYFSKKWTMEMNDKAYCFLPTNDPAYGRIVDMARNAYKYIMSNVGYGRVDFRIDEATGEPYFLEINPNCGMWYSEKDGGDFADLMVKNDPHWNHEKFLNNAVSRALKEQAARKPWYFISHDKNGQFSTRAARTVPEGKCLFGDATHPIPVIAKALFKLGEAEPSVGCVVQRGDGIHQAVAIRHSCQPNMNFVHGRTLMFAAKRQINSGEELTVDYATLRDESMPHFACSCGVENCRSVVFAMPPTPRTVELKTMRKILREKKRVWMQGKIDKEAELMLKKRVESK